MSKNKWKFVFPLVILILSVTGYQVFYHINIKNYRLISDTIAYHSHRNSEAGLLSENRQLEILNHNLSKNVNQFLEKYPTKNRSSQMYKLMAGILDSHMIRLNNLNPRSIDEDSIFTQMIWDLSLTAPFEKFLGFIKELEDHQLVFSIEKLHIQRKSNKKKNLNIDLQLRVKIRSPEK
jgi:hypothetical protein